MHGFYWCLGRRLRRKKIKMEEKKMIDDGELMREKKNHNLC